MLLPILATVGLAAVTLWLSFFAARYLVPRLSAARQTSLKRIAQDPGDEVRAWAVRVAPSRLRLQQQTARARRHLVRARARAAYILTAFKDGKAPTLTFKITAISMSALWLVSVTGAFLLDLPIIISVSGGKENYGILGALLLLGVPIIGSLLLGHYFSMWRRGRLGELAFSVVATVILTAVAIVFVLLAHLAPIRSEVEYADKIRAAEQQLTMYKDNGDPTAVTYAEQNLSDLEAQEQRSAQWNTALVPIAAASEFVTGFFVPLAVPVLMLGEARGSQRRAQRVLDTAEERENNLRTRQYRRLSRFFRRAGVTQAELQRHYVAVAAENGQAPQETTPRAHATFTEELPVAQRTQEDPARTSATASSVQPTADGNTLATEGPLAAAGEQPVATVSRRAQGSGAASSPVPPAPPEQELDVPDESFDLS